MINHINHPSTHPYRKSQLKIVKCLITEGHCDVNIGDSSGDTPLHLTCR